MNLTLYLVWTLGAALLFALLPAQAAHCTTYSTTTTDLERGQIVVETPWTSGESALYWVLNVCRSTCSYSFFSTLWAEGNDIPGLQRLDVVFDDTCHQTITHDTQLV